MEKKNKFRVSVTKALGDRSDVQHYYFNGFTDEDALNAFKNIYGYQYDLTKCVISAYKLPEISKAVIDDAVDRRIDRKYPAFEFDGHKVRASEILKNCRFYEYHTEVLQYCTDHRIIVSNFRNGVRFFDNSKD